jgi:hypothetical protein
LSENLGKSAKETLAMIKQAFGEQRMSRVYIARSIQSRIKKKFKKKARQVKSKVKSMLFIFFGLKGIVHKEFVLASRTVNSAYSHIGWYYCHVLRRLRENVIRFLPELLLQKNWQLHHNNSPSHTFLFTGEFFLPKTT